MSYRDGQTATNPKTGQTVVYNAASDTWVATKGAPAAVGSPMGSPMGRKMSPQDVKALQALSDNAEGARTSARDASAAVAATKRLGTGPWKGTLLDAAIPEGNGFMDALGGAFIGGPMKLIGALNDKDVNDYQTVRRAQNEGILAKQIEQKGPQTESDAARMALTGVLTTNTPQQTQLVADKNMLLAKRAAARRDFLTKWANIYGLEGVNEKGQTGNQVFDGIWNGVEAEAANAPKRKTPTIRRVQ